jgi:transposase
MLSTEQINDLHRLYWSEHWPIRKIERQLKIGWKTIRKYLDAPAQNCAHRDRPSKLDPFKAAISEWIEKDPMVTAAVLEQKLRAMGYDGGHSILREHVRNIRPKAAPRRAFVRMEPIAGERFEVDWGHFGTLDYSGDSRKLYAFVLVERSNEPLVIFDRTSGRCASSPVCTM